MKKYTTLNLWPASATLAQMGNSKASNDPVEFELTLEEPGVSELDGYYVRYRTGFKKDGNYIQGELEFHLVKWHGEWKIEDIYIVSYNHHPLENWVSIARDYQQLAPASREIGKAEAPAKIASETKASSQKQWYENQARGSRWPAEA